LNALVVPVNSIPLFASWVYDSAIFLGFDLAYPEVRIEDSIALEVVIEIPRGSFVKRSSSGSVDFVSLFPCPFNYGSVDAFMGTDGDFLDAVVLGPRMRRGARLTARAIGAVRFVDRGIAEDKIICSDGPIGPVTRSLILLFFRFYSIGKRLLYLLRGASGSCYCAGWCDPKTAMERAHPRIP
jgi:inorganic pyrophosphatase